MQIVDRLGEEIVGTGLQAAYAIRRLVERGDHDDRDMGRARIGLQPLADLEAVHFRHHDVEQDHIDLGSIANVEGVAAIARGEDVEIFRHEPRFEQLHIGGNIIDDQYARSHVT